METKALPASGKISRLGAAAAEPPGPRTTCKVPLKSDPPALFEPVVTIFTIGSSSGGSPGSSGSSSGSWAKALAGGRTTAKIAATQTSTGVSARASAAIGPPR